jgi:hypothetical protein
MNANCLYATTAAHRDTSTLLCLVSVTDRRHVRDGAQPAPFSKMAKSVAGALPRMKPASGT